jgi:ATP-dependent Clp protease adaptor protein ClpS
METITIEKTDIDISELTDILNKKHLVVFNDDVNSFDYVIDTFCKVLNHNTEQASQCALIIHNKGKCSVKEGVYDKLKPAYEALRERHLLAEIQ